MISIDQLEILLRSIPQYFLFGALAFYLFAWIEKKPKLGIVAEIILVISGIAAMLVLLSGIIPSPLSAGMVQQHVEMVIKMLTLLSVTGLLALISLIIRIVRKATFLPLILITFALSIFIFFSSTRLSKIKFELNLPAQTENNQE